jgi:ketosteroid isomerase-like protein
MRVKADGTHGGKSKHWGLSEPEGSHWTCPISLIIAFFLILASACPHPATTVEASQRSLWEQELRAADIDFCRETTSRRLDGWMDFFADDAAILHDGITVAGKAELRKYYEPIFANKDFVLTWAPTHVEASRDGSLGYTYGSYEAKNSAEKTHGMYITIWRRIAGQWKVIMDTGSMARR